MNASSRQDWYLFDGDPVDVEGQYLDGKSWAAVQLRDRSTSCTLVFETAAQLDGLLDRIRDAGSEALAARTAAMTEEVAS